MKNLFISIRVLIVFTLLTGLLYPLLITKIGSLVFPRQTSGSLIERNGKTLGSQLIAQAFTQKRYFWPRPSSVKYDAASSGASNLGLTSAALVANVREREQKGFVGEMLFESGSGLDPHISRMAASSQVDRIARERGLTTSQTQQLQALLVGHTEPRQFGFLGEERVNVVNLNLALDEAFSK